MPSRSAWMALLGAGGWVLGAVPGCGERHDPLTERCIEALADHSPSHGAVERIERGPSQDRWAITILYRTGPSPAEPRPFRCEYEVGNRWRLVVIADTRA